MSSETVQFYDEQSPWTASVAAGLSTNRAQINGDLVAKLTLAAAILAGVVLVAVWWAGVDMGTAIPIAALSALAFTPGCAALLDKRVDPCSPIQFCAAYFLVAYAGRAIYLSLNLEAERVGAFYYEDYLPIALWTAVLAFGAFTAGYAAVRLDRPIRRILSYLPSLAFGTEAMVPCALLAIGALGALRMALVYGFTAGRSDLQVRESAASPIPGWIPLVCDLVPMAFGICACCAFSSRLSRRQRRSALVCMVPCAMVVVGRAALTGSKEAIVLPFGMLLLSYHYQRRRISAPRAGIAMLIAITALFPLFNITRGKLIPEAGGFPTSWSAAASLASHAGEYFGSLTLGEYLVEGAGGLLDRSAGVDALSLVMKYTPATSPYKLGQDYLVLPVASLVPRSLWPNKPLIDGSGDYERTYLNSYRQTFSSPHLIPDFYRNFGLAGVVVGAFVVGVCFKKLYATFAPFAAFRPECALWYGYCVLNCVHWLEADFVSYACTLMRDIPLLLLATWLAAKFPQTRNRET